MVTKSSSLSTLRQSRLMATRSDVEAFERALAGLVASPDQSMLPDLFLTFTDATKQHDVMWGLLHFVESFGMEGQLQAMIKVLPSMLTDAPEWTEIFHHRILNDDKYRSFYRKVLAAQPKAIKLAAEQVLKRIKVEDSDFATRVDEILST